MAEKVKRQKTRIETKMTWGKKKKHELEDDDDEKEEDEEEETEREKDEREEEEEEEEEREQKRGNKPKNSAILSTSTEKNVAFVEREITLSLLNEKLNFVISTLQKMEGEII